MTTAIRDQFMERVRMIKSYDEAVALMAWDLRTGAPRAGVPQRSQTLGLLQTESFKLTIDDQMGEWIEALSNLKHGRSLRLSSSAWWKSCGAVSNGGARFQRMSSESM